MLEQSITTIRNETHKKNWSAQIWVKRAKIGPEIIFFAVFSSLDH